MFDKTGTLTVGQPRAGETVTAPGVERDEVLRLAASVEQLAGHVLAAAVVREAQRRGLALTMPDLLATLCGLDAVLRLQLAEEGEAVYSLR